MRLPLIGLALLAPAITLAQGPAAVGARAPRTVLLPAAGIIRNDMTKAELESEASQVLLALHRFVAGDDGKRQEDERIRRALVRLIAALKGGKDAAETVSGLEKRVAALDQKMLDDEAAAILKLSPAFVPSAGLGVSRPTADPKAERKILPPQEEAAAQARRFAVLMQFADDEFKTLAAQTEPLRKTAARLTEAAGLLPDADDKSKAEGEARAAAKRVEENGRAVEGRLKLVLRRKLEELHADLRSGKIRPPEEKKTLP